MSRGRIGSFSRDSDSTTFGGDEPEWLREYSKNLQKNSVHSLEHDRSTYDQISEIMGTKSKYSTVEDAVKDMRARTGLDLYLTQVAATVKQASEKEEELEVTLPGDDTPSVFAEHPEVEKFIRKYVDSRKGHTSIAAVLVDVGRLFKDIESSALDDKTLKKFINRAIVDARKLNPIDEELSGELLGSVEKSNDQDFEDNNDAFSSLMPAKY